jgi:hypothetical protein
MLISKEARRHNATLEDWGRFGEFVARDGRLSNGKQLVPTGWFDQAASWTKALNSVSAAHPEVFTAISGGITRFRRMRKTSSRRRRKG